MEARWLNGITGRHEGFDSFLQVSPRVSGHEHTISLGCRVGDARTPKQNCQAAAECHWALCEIFLYGFKAAPKGPLAPPRLAQPSSRFAPARLASSASRLARKERSGAAETRGSRGAAAD